MSRSIVENDLFIYLLLAAKEDNKMRNRILNVLRQDDVTRFKELEDWALESEKRQAPHLFVEALRYLKMPDVAFSAIEVLLEAERHNA